MRACAVEDELDTDELGEIVASFEDVIWLSRELIGSTNFRLHDVPLKVYDRKLELGEKGMLDAKERLVDYHRYPTLAALVVAYEEWQYAPFFPHRIQGHGYCLDIETHNPHRMMALPFSMIADTLAEIRNRICDSANGQPLQTTGKEPPQ